MNVIGAGIPAYPLRWPDNKPRTTWHKREADPFRLPLGRARDSLLKELELAGVRDVVISSNAALLRDGRIAANQGRIEDPGVAVYGERRGLRLVFANDKYDNVAANVRAIAKTIGAMRGIERWGTSEMVDAAFSGFAALPAGGTGAGWWEVLGVAPDAGRAEVDAAYRALAMEHHPDRGGDAEQFRRITEAYDSAKR